MFSTQALDEVLDSFYGDLEFGFIYGLGFTRLIWRPWDRGQQFTIELRRDSNCLVLAWGYPDSTLHDAIWWSGDDPVGLTCQDCGGPHSPEQMPCPPMHIKVPENRLYSLARQEVRRVLDFADPNHKRRVEFAELNAVFVGVVTGWEAYLDTADMNLLHASELPSGSSLKLEYPDRSSCRLLHDDNAFHVHCDEHGWRIDITRSGRWLTPGTWRLAEEVVASEATTDAVVSLSELREEVLRSLVGM